jgi:hypothetical protein
MAEETLDRPYTQRCATCRHDVWQNEAVGDCQVFSMDVLHHSVEPCQSYERRAGSLDCFGYLRWTPTSCLRCGYERADCTCIGGFCPPKPETAAMEPDTTARRRK